jgi:hypothetical protein
MENKQAKNSKTDTDMAVPSGDSRVQAKPSQQDDPTSAQDDPDLPDEEALIPLKADVEAKESLDYFTPSEEFPDPGSGSNYEPDETEEDASPEIISGTDADVTAEDLAALGPRDEDMDMGEDETLRASDLLVKQTDETSDEEPEEALDVPGADEDDGMEDSGMEDEENNEYSLGGDKD